jgi:hypothetical protein
MFQLAGSRCFCPRGTCSWAGGDGGGHGGRPVRYTDGIMARTYAHATGEDLARTLGPGRQRPVRSFHPCQALADYLTVRERFGARGGFRSVNRGRQ